MPDYITFEVYDKLEGDGGKVIEVAARKPRQNSGWQSVMYKNKYYKLWGGIRTPYRIYLEQLPEKTDQEFDPGEP